jgi:peptidoglycan/xylan/chitin deacetylase (PgdA/CDA1 family)
LEAHGCRGTFFLLGSAVESAPGTVSELAAARHELGNHLWSHSHPGEQSRAELRDEIARTAAAIGRVTGVEPALVRPPYCEAPKAVARAVGRGGPALVVLRSVDPADWRAVSAQEIVEGVLSAVEPGDIVCMHDGVAPRNRGTDTRSATATAVAELVPELIRRGLRPVTVSELLA